MNGDLPEAEVPAGTLSEAGTAAEWRAYPEQHLDEIEANLRANGPNSTICEIREFCATMVRIAPGVDVVKVGRAVIAAAREAARDARALADLRKEARSEIDLALRFGASPDGELGLPRIVMTAERAGVDSAIANAPLKAFLLPRDDLRRERALTLALRTLYEALAAPGMTATHARRLAERIAVIYSIATGRLPTVTNNSVTSLASGAWCEFISASAALAGINAQPSEISNVARTVANPMKKRAKSRVN